MMRGIREKKCNSHLANVNGFKKARDSRGEKNCNIIGNWKEIQVSVSLPPRGTEFAQL